jgi:hypothetical protein
MNGPAQEVDISSTKITAHIIIAILSDSHGDGTFYISSHYKFHFCSLGDPIFEIGAIAILPYLIFELWYVHPSDFPESNPAVNHRKHLFCLSFILLLTLCRVFPLAGSFHSTL